ncbi:CBS domain-containing protein [Mycoplasmatota bacterium]|nr:CBS domain-containing protein [Mycoplasmatota bacterium]
MNILFWLTPKEKVAYIYDDSTLRQAFEKMEIYRYAVIPVLDREGHYYGTISEGDLLWYIKNHQQAFKHSEKLKIKDISRNKDNKKITVETEMDDLLNIVTQQNFVPVVDDYDYFIGIITRKSIFEYLMKKANNNEKK